MATPIRAAPIRHRPHFGVGLVARVIQDPRGAAVGVGNRLGGVVHGVRACPRSHVREVHQHPAAVHLVDDVAPEVRESAVSCFPAPASHEVLGVVRELHHPHPEIAEQLDELGPVLERGSVLPAEDDAGALLLLRPEDVGAAVYRCEKVVVVPEPALPLRDVLHRCLKALPYRAGAVRRAESARPHVLEYRPAPLGDDQPIDDDGILMQGRRVHDAISIRSPLKVRES